MTYSKDKVRATLEKLQIMMYETPDEFERRYYPYADPESIKRDIAEALRLLDAPEGEGREGPQWIPVSERLPDAMPNVLTTDGVYVWQMYYGPSRSIGYKITGAANPVCWRDESDHYPATATITHWMPLPEPPNS